MPSKLSQEQFIAKCIQAHGYKYDYSKSIYIDKSTPVIITCPIHGEFLQKPSIHYYDKCGCQKCDPTEITGTKKFIEKATIKHNDLYDYSKVEYKKTNIKIEIVCKKHGSFFQQPAAHLRGQGCPKCCDNKKSNNEEFIIKSMKKHGDLYDYSLIKYENKNSMLDIICIIHGIFTQRANNHLSGYGCLICSNSKMELYLRNKLLELNIKFEQNKKFEQCKRKKFLPFDFYIYEHNLLIECDGIQHHEPVNFFGGEKRFKAQQLKDSIKNDFANYINKYFYSQTQISF